MVSYSAKALLMLLVVVVLSTMAFAELDECKGTVNQEQVPCLVFLPYMGDCTAVDVSFFRNGSTFIYTEQMFQLNSFTCNATFTEDELGTYVFNYTTGDSGSITVEEGNMNFFNMLVFAVFTLMIFGLTWFMHRFKEDDPNTAITFGWIATGISMILVALILSPNFEIISGVLLFFNTDWYIAVIIAMFGLYTGLVSTNLRRASKPMEEW